MKKCTSIQFFPSAAGRARASRPMPCRAPFAIVALVTCRFWSASALKRRVHRHAPTLAWKSGSLSANAISTPIRAFGRAAAPAPQAATSPRRREANSKRAAKILARQKAGGSCLLRSRVRRRSLGNHAHFGSKTEIATSQYQAVRLAKNVNCAAMITNHP